MPKKWIVHRICLPGYIISANIISKKNFLKIITLCLYCNVISGFLCQPISYPPLLCLNQDWLAFSCFSFPQHSDMNEEMRTEAMELCVTACEKFASNNEVRSFSEQK